MKNVFQFFILCIVVFATGCQTISEKGKASPQASAISGPNDFSVIVTVYPVETVHASVTIDPRAVGSLDPMLQEIVSLVTDDLNQRIGIAVENIHLLELESIEWPDSGLGCGQPGEVYLPVLTPGYRIALEADGQRYVYHTNTSNSFILCDEPRPIMITPTP